MGTSVFPKFSNNPCNFSHLIKISQIGPALTNQQLFINCILLINPVAAISILKIHYLKQSKYVN